MSAPATAVDEAAQPMSAPFLAALGLLIGTDAVLRSGLRRPEPYASSWRRERWQVETLTGTVVALAAKRVDDDGLLPDARRLRAATARDLPTECRLVGVVGRGAEPLLAPLGIVEVEGTWLVSEQLSGCRLDETGDASSWAAAGWAARSLHTSADLLAATAPVVPRYDADRCSEPITAAVDDLAASPDASDRALARRIEAVAAVAAHALAAAPVVVVHGELYAPNVFVADSEQGGAAGPPSTDHRAIRFLDLETLGHGAAALDLAALLTGLPSALAATLLDAYGDPTGVVGPAGFERELAAARLVHACRWWHWTVVGGLAGGDRWRSELEAAVAVLTS